MVDVYEGGRRTVKMNLSALQFAAQMLPVIAGGPKAEPPKPKTAKVQSNAVDHEWMKKRKKLLAKLRGK
jgi:hypothetical protein